MGWADCGKDSKGRSIGYAFIAKCDQPGCKRKIDRGLSYACGGMHGGGVGCKGYFCSKHLRCVLVEEDNPMMCDACASIIEKEAKDFPNAEEDEFEELDAIKSDITEEERKAIQDEEDFEVSTEKIEIPF